MTNSIKIRQLQDILAKQAAITNEHLDSLKALEFTFSSPIAYNSSVGYWQGYRDAVRALQTYLIDVRQSVEDPAITLNGTQPLA